MLMSIFRRILLTPTDMRAYQHVKHAELCKSLVLHVATLDRVAGGFHQV